MFLTEKETERRNNMSKYFSNIIEDLETRTHKIYFTDWDYENALIIPSEKYEDFKRKYEELGTLYEKDFDDDIIEAQRILIEDTIISPTEYMERYKEHLEAEKS